VVGVEEVVVEFGGLTEEFGEIHSFAILVILSFTTSQVLLCCSAFWL